MKTFSVLFLLSLIILAIYFSLTWYFFGSSDPCDILQARMMPHRVETIRTRAMQSEREHSRLGEMTRFEDPEIRRLIEEDWKKIQEAPQTAMKELREEISRLSLTECIYQAITWTPSIDTQQP